jgi:two-component system, sensor histidine kinase LadS
MDLINLFSHIDREQFSQSFSDDEKCLAILSEEKWKDGFVCRHCGNSNFCRGKKSHSRRCTRCKREESATAHTIFHHCRIPITKAFELAYLVCTTPGLTVADLSHEMATRQMTCWKLRKQVLTCIKEKQALKA